jgi:Ca2+-binding RTX toxin-like protein
MDGGLGNDAYSVESVNDTITEASGGGDDRVWSTITLSLTDNVERLYLEGGAVINGYGNSSANIIEGNTAANELHGGDGDDDLYGDAGNDRLEGGIGNDTVNGGAGNDSLSGGPNQDIFRFDRTLNAGANLDVVDDFAAVDDTFQLENAVFAALPTGPLAETAFYANAGAVAANDPTDRVIYNITTGTLFYDADGSETLATAVQFATLTGSPDGVTAADFVVT